MIQLGRFQRGRDSGIRTWGQGTFNVGQIEDLTWYVQGDLPWEDSEELTGELGDNLRYVGDRD